MACYQHCLLPHLLPLPTITYHSGYRHCGCESETMVWCSGSLCFGAGSKLQPFVYTFVVLCLGWLENM